jgi:hypothetical protein
MKRAGKIVICLAGGLALYVGLRADDAVSSSTTDNPYAPIVVRNVFGLVPPPPPAPPPDDTDATLPKITPNGIMSIFGSLQVLFKVDTVATPGKQSEEESYILTQGERQDDIEVVKINEKAAMVTFNNHGTIQELSLTPNADTSASQTTMTPFPPNRFGHRGFGGRGHRGWNNGSSGPTFGTYSPPPPVQPPVNQQPNNQNAAPQNSPANQIPQGMTPETQIIAIEANRILTQQQVEDGLAPPLPITELTPPDATGPGGLPLRSNPDNSGGDDTSGNGDNSRNGNTSGGDDGSGGGVPPP